MIAATLLLGSLLALGIAATPAYAHPNLGQGCRCHGGSKTPSTTSKKSSKPAQAPAARPAQAPVAQAPVAPPAPVIAPEPPVTLGTVDPLHGGVHFVGEQSGYGGRADR